MAWCTERSARLPIQSNRSWSSARSRSKWRSIFFRPHCVGTGVLACPYRPLAEPAGDVGLGSGVGWGGEQLGRGTELHQLAIQQEGLEVADPRGLLHVVRHNHDSPRLFQVEEEFLYFCCVDRIERSEERRVGKSVDLGGRRMIQKNR